MASALESHSSSLSGFVAKNFTFALLVDAVDDSSLRLEQCGTFHRLLLDFAKSSGYVYHEHLLLKLNSLGIHGHILNWL